MGHLVTDSVTVDENVDIFTPVQTCLDHVGNISEHVLNMSMECLVNGTIRGTGLDHVEASYSSAPLLD